MHQCPHPIWQEIARTQKISRPLWRRLMESDNPQPMLDQVESDLEKAGANARMIRAFLLVAPLLDESEAISRYVEATGRTDLRNSLPEINSLNEAVILAAQEYRLIPSQTMQLKKLLQTFPTT